MDACDAVDVVAPTSYHFDLCQLALRKGKHVFVEKPLAQSLDEARELVKLAKESNRKCQVGHVERFNPAFLALNTLDVAPRFIEVHRLAEFNPRGTDVSVVLDLMIHDIDIILHLVKSNVSSVSANGVSVISDTPDIANVRLEFDNGCVANLTSSRISLKKMRKMRLFQKDAYIGIDFLERKTEIVRMDEDTSAFDFHFELDTPNGKKTIGIQSPKIEPSNAIRLELEAFRDAVLNNTEPPVSIIDGFRAMEVAHLILDKIQRQAH
jgi:predicted dehydrogenase